jgi:hypothetical protein
MQWDAFAITAVLIILIILLQWPIIKKAPIKDKVVFASFLFIGWSLTLLDLMQVPGLNSILKAIFLPIARVIGL